MTSIFRPGLSLWPKDTCLLTELASELGRLSSDELAATAVILPTQRLGINLLAMLAKQRGAFRPPVVKTLETFVRDETSDLELPTGLPDMVQELLLNNIIKDRAFCHLHPGHEHELKQFFGELTEHNVSDGIAKLVSVIESDFYHDPQHIKSLIDRFREMGVLQQEFFSVLKANGWATNPEILRMRATALLDRIQGGQSLHFERIYFSCFTTIKPCFIPLLREASARDSVAIWLSESPELYGSFSPLSELARGLSEKLASPRMGRARAWTPSCSIHESDDVFTECATALEIADRYLKAGVKPSQIAVLLTDENRHGKLLRELIAAKGIRANIAIALPMGQTIIGDWMQCFQQLIIGGEAVGDVLSIAIQPITLAWLVAQSPPEKALTADDFKRLIGDSLCRQDCFSGLGTLANSVKNEDVANALRLLKEWVDNFLGISAGRTQDRWRLSQWADRLQQLFENLNVTSAVPVTDPGLQKSMVAATDLFFKQLLALRNLSDPELTVREFFRLAGGHFATLDGRSIGYPLAGLQVVNVVEARYVPFQVVIIVGMTEGAFPKSIPADNLVDDWLKQRIGLPGWKYVESLEDTTFHLFAARIPHLELSYAKENSGEPTVRSRFVEALLNAGKGRIFRWESTSHLEPLLLSSLVAAPRREPARRLGEPGDFRGERGAFFTSASASNLKLLLTCPYRYLFQRLGISELSLPEDNRNRIEGQWLHAILEGFFTGEVAGRRLFDPLSAERVNSACEIELCNRFQSITDRVFPPPELGSPVYHHLIRHSWPRFVRHLLSLTTSSEKFSPDQQRKEFKIGERFGEHPAAVTIENLTISLRGSVDSIDVFGPYHLLTDYKRHGVDSNREIFSGISPQLGLYALALGNLANPQNRLAAANSILGHWSVRNGTWHPSSVGTNARDWAISVGLATKKTHDSEDLIANLVGLWSLRIKALMQDHTRFSPDPAPERWCSLCPMPNICRVHDPQLASSIMALQTMAGKVPGGDSEDGQ